MKRSDAYTTGYYQGYNEVMAEEARKDQEAGYKAGVEQANKEIALRRAAREVGQ